MEPEYSVPKDFRPDEVIQVLLHPSPTPFHGIVPGAAATPVG
jgi:hypothetical protein